MSPVDAQLERMHGPIGASCYEHMWLVLIEAGGGPKKHSQGALLGAADVCLLGIRYLDAVLRLSRKPEGATCLIPRTIL
jgi:hypothetical protein